MHGIIRKCIVAAFLFRDGVTGVAAKTLSSQCAPIKPVYFDILGSQWIIVVFLDNQQNRAAVAELIRRFETQKLELSGDIGLGIRCGDVLLGIEGELIVSTTRPIGYPMSEAMSRAQHTTRQHQCEGCNEIL